MDVSEWKIGDVLMCIKDDAVITEVDFASYRCGQIVKIVGITSNGGHVRTINMSGVLNGWSHDSFEWLDRGNFDDYVRITML